MATATRSKKKTKKKARRVSTGKPRRKAAAKQKSKAAMKRFADDAIGTKVGKNGAASIAPASADKFAPNQPPLSGMEDVDERIPELEEACQKVLSDRDATRSYREKVREGREAVGDLLEKNELNCYTVNGNKFFIEPGERSVKIKKVKQDG